ncbi:Transcriptional regulator, LysR family [Pseudomonas chlororaphis subsp. aurantiaca]|nr:Transcriptional regulator, LysR family [Pseudomonas chlororaphis subsp. aurantiaca]
MDLSAAQGPCAQARAAGADPLRCPQRHLAGRRGQAYRPRQQVEATLTFILSGQHIGYLPSHFARVWEDQGLLKALRPRELSYDVGFYLARHRAQVPGDAQQAFEEDLLAAFGQAPHPLAAAVD